MKYAGEREGVRRLAMKVLARAVTDGDLSFIQEPSFPMWLALAEEGSASRIINLILKEVECRRAENGEL